MRFPIISTIYKKEILEVLRDKKMLYLVILMPFFLYPVLFTLMGKVGASTRDKINTERVAVTINPEAEGSTLAKMLAADTTLNLTFATKTTAELDSMRGKALAILLPAESDVQRLTADSLAVQTIKIYGDDTEDVVGSRRRRIEGMLGAYGQQITNQRLTDRGLNPSFVSPIVIEQQDTASERATSGRLMGTIIPVMLLLFIFIGCIYIAIDTTAGEKERRTLQTIYTTPVSTNEIISGKFLAVASVGLVSAFANLGSLLLSMKIQASMMGAGDAPSPFSLTLAGPDLVWIIVLVILATIFLAAVSMAVVLLANSYKEAQGYVTPLMMGVLVPAMMASMPGMELNMTTAMIPMFNICLAMSDIFAGTYSISMIGLVAVFALLYGLAGLWLAGRTFGNESVVTGEKVDWKNIFSGR
jgi:sodium transport system permease protein